jgi:hypothetical protein
MWKKTIAGVLGALAISVVAIPAASAYEHEYARVDHEHHHYERYEHRRWEHERWEREQRRLEELRREEARRRWYWEHRYDRDYYRW